jgi:hypothetical protein
MYVCMYISTVARVVRASTRLGRVLVPLVLEWVHTCVTAVQILDNDDL